jgi:hypothetical protein
VKGTDGTRECAEHAGQVAARFVEGMPEGERVAHLVQAARMMERKPLCAGLSEDAARVGLNTFLRAVWRAL